MATAERGKQLPKVPVLQRFLARVYYPNRCVPRAAQILHLRRDLHP
jgi:hypothetical protein